MKCGPNSVASVTAEQAQAKVTYLDPLTDATRTVRCYQLDDERSVLAFQDADGQAVVAVLTPALESQLLAALALANLPGARVTARP